MARGKKKSGNGPDKPAEPEVISPQKVMGTGTVGEALGTAVDSGHALVMLENERMFSVAIQRPRDEKAILQKMLDIVNNSSVFAEDALYSKPVGREFNPETRQYDGEMKYAEGFSIRFAEEMRRLYGNNGTAVTLTDETPEGRKVAGVFVDYENATRLVIEKVAPRSYTTRNKQVIMHPPDRYVDIVIPKNVSIVMREVINRSTPAWIKAEVEVAIRNKRNKTKPEERRKGIIAGFAKIGVAESHLVGYLNKPSSDWKHRDLDILQGIGVAIKDGDLNIEEVFGIKVGKKATEPEQEKKTVLTPKEPEKDITEKSTLNTFDPILAKNALLAAKDKGELDQAWNVFVKGKVNQSQMMDMSDIYNERVAQIPG